MVKSTGDQWSPLHKQFIELMLINANQTETIHQICIRIYQKECESFMKCRILIVEDEYLLRQGIKNLVDWEKEGFIVAGEASNGAEALEQAALLNPHIVITDIVMPVMNGIDFISVIKERYPDIEIIVLSSYSDFDYVRTAMKNGVNDYLLKPALNPEILLETVKKAAADIDGLDVTADSEYSCEIAVRKILSGFQSEIPDSEISRLFIYDRFIIAGTDISYIFGSDEPVRKHETILNEMMKKYFDNLSFCSKYVCVNPDSKSLVIVVNFKKAFLSDIENALKRVFSEISKKYKGSCYAVFRPVDRIYKIRELYSKHFRLLIEQHFYFPERYFITSDYLAGNTGSSKFNFANFQSSLDMMCFDEASEMLSDYVRITLAERSMNEFEIKSFVQNAVYNMIMRIEESESKNENLISFKQECFIRISDAKSADKLFEALKFILENCCQMVFAHSISANSKTINKILDYINVHYNEPLTLKTLADTFNFNYYYLSSYFASHCSEGFSAYLNKVRINKACELLRKGIMPISEICGAVGYTDHSYFTKVFKKFTGVTPKQFRSGSA